jgi:His/Glu/Gln/Arg/opine family amino acid ABC transporter permease subunit
MPGSYSEPEVYVAPRETPPSRRPPVTTVGPLGWLRQNLFSSPVNTLATFVTTAVLVWFLWVLLTWTVRSSQWGVIFNNLRLIGSGLYDKEEIWRVEWTAIILVLLSGLSIGLWGFITRRAIWIVMVILAAVLLIPWIGSKVSAPRVYVLVEPSRTPYTLIFLGAKDQEVTFKIDPITDPADADEHLVGYIENTRSRTEWYTRARDVQDGKLDLSQHTLKLTATLTDQRGGALTDPDGTVQVISTPDQLGGQRTTKLPRDGWYMIQVVRDDAEKDKNAGYAWLKVDGVDLFPSQQDAIDALVAEYGPLPAPQQALLADQNSYRFEGTQNFAEFVSLQVSPFFRNTARSLFGGVVLFANGWIIGTLGRRERRVRRLTLAGWILAGPVILILLRGFEGSRSLPMVSTRLWGGLLLTFLLTFTGIVASFPLGVLLALGRRSELPVVKWTCTLFIETVRGVPLITILFMAKLIIPFFSSALVNIDLTVRMMIGTTLFSAAYLAENVRGGLQIIPRGQIEASRALGMNPALTMTLIVLPQALRAVIPAIVGQFISLFKDTSLVAIVGLYELVGMVDTIIKGQTVYRPYQREAYIFVALVYFVISYAMSDVSRRLEASGAGSTRRLK